MKKTRSFTNTQMVRTVYNGYIRKTAQPRLHDYLQAIATARHTWSGPSFGEGPFTGERRRKAPYPVDAEASLIH